jgi:hypothetical protein
MGGGSRLVRAPAKRNERPGCSYWGVMKGTLHLKPPSFLGFRSRDVMGVVEATLHAPMEGVLGDPRSGERGGFVLIRSEECQGTQGGGG